MKLIHLSDLHLGKRVNEFSMLEDQRYILKRIINIIDDEGPDAVIIAGDVYDKATPSTEAIELFDDFIVSLAERDLNVFIISGNHDSAERLAFGGRIMDTRGVHFSPVYNGEVKPIELNDGCVSVNVYMLPFLKPANVRRFYPEDEISSYSDAVSIAIKNMAIDKSKINILVTHQFVTGALRSESEDISLGGADNIDASVFKDFDYVALGHIHGPQNIGSKKIRYCGTPLKYSFSEVSHKKSVSVVEFSEKGELSLKTVPLVPLRDMVELKGTYDELTNKSFYEGTSYQKDYVHITLTDEENIFDAVSKLRSIYKNLMKIDYDNMRTRNGREMTVAEDIENKTPLELFSEFYLLQNGSEMSNEQREFMENIINEVWEGEQ